MQPTLRTVASHVAWIALAAAFATGCGDDSGSTSDDAMEDDSTNDGGSDDDDDDSDDDDSDDDDSDDDDSDDDDDDSLTDDDSDDDDSLMDDDSDDSDDDLITDDDSDDDSVTDDSVDAGADDSSADDDAVDSGADDDSTEDDIADDAVTDDEVDSGADDDVITDDGVDSGADDDSTDDDVADDASPVETVFEPVLEQTSDVHANVHDLRGLVFAADGKIYASGHVGATNDVDRELAVMRFNADGSADDSFGTAGLVTHNIAEMVLDGETVTHDGDEQSLAIVELESGELVVSVNYTDASGLGTDTALVKLDADGALVSSFGTDGVLRVDFGWTPTDDANYPTADSAPSDSAWDLKLDTSSGTEKLVLFGYGPAEVGELTDAEDPLTQRTDSDRYVLRLLASDGSMDPAFNGGEAFSLNSLGTFSDGARRGHVAADGSIISGGYTNFGDGLGNHVLAIKLLENGTLDPSFGFGIGIPGVVRTNPFIDDGGMAECYAVGVQSSGMVVTTGYGRATGAGLSSRLGYATTDSVDLVSFRLTDAGLDHTFGTEGTFVIQSEEFGLAETEERGRDMVVLPDDRMVHVGRFGTGPAIMVTLPDGGMDLDSGFDGRFEYSTDTEHFFKAALSADGSTVAATTRNHEAGVRLVLLSVGE